MMKEVKISGEREWEKLHRDGDVEVVVRNQDFTGLNFLEWNFDKVTFIHCDMGSCRMVDCSFLKSTFINCNCEWTNFKGSLMVGMTMKKCKCEGASFKNCDLDRSTLKNNDFTGVRWKGASVYAIKFSNCKVDSLHPIVGTDMKGKEVE